MMNCGRVESAGRASLLNAVSTIMEYSFWTEARTFHNLIMVKLEQDRISWDADFTDLANQFLDKKVRQSLRFRDSNTDSTYYKYESGDKGFGKFNSNNFGSSNSNYSSNRNKALYSVVCWQWNNGICYYGDKCKKWHVCRTCAEAGKPGETHKSSSHNDSSTDHGRNGMRV